MTGWGRPRTVSPASHPFPGHRRDRRRRAPRFPETRPFVVIGGTDLARGVCATLQYRGHAVAHLTTPGDTASAAAPSW
ncbi:hypothetical protein [Streptomyces sp. NBC_01171]|uniref:hypothetical protein n=1 Tax=Streptomyces sp. NBC_01171 TaxID=2903757 RepID=UPI00386739B6|nr:hypothetical protein OG448_01175 [Streptomyces sp. NBC_01171]